MELTQQSFDATGCTSGRNLPGSCGNSTRRKQADRSGGDLGPVQSQLVEDLSNFCHSCGMLDCQSGFAETTGFREIQRDSKMLPLQHKHLPSALPSPLALGRTILFVLFISFHASSSVASRGATHRAALGFTVQDPSLLAKLR